MLQLVSFPQLMSARARAAFSSVKNILSVLLVLACMLTFSSAYGQDITMPTVEVDGVDGDSDGASILITIIKFVARIAIWIVMALAGLVALKTVLKSWNEQKSNDQGKWGAVIGDSLGSVVLVIFVIAVGTWVLTFLS